MNGNGFVDFLPLVDVSCCGLFPCDYGKEAVGLDLRS